jgi:hypothetical protein
VDQKLRDALKAELDKLGRAEPVSGRRKLLRALFYGDFGSGKSTLSLNCVEERGIWITTDSAWVVADKYPELAQKMERYDYTGFSQLQAIALAHKEGIEPYGAFDTLIWDTASTGIKRTLREMVKKNKFNDQRHAEVESWTHFNLVKAKLTETLEILSNSDLNIIYTMHQQQPVEDDVKKQRSGLRGNAPGASFDIIAQEVQLIGWLHKERAGAKRVIQLEGTTRETAKSQISTIPEKTYLQDEIPNLIRKWKLQ